MDAYCHDSPAGDDNSTIFKLVKPQVLLADDDQTVLEFVTIVLYEYMGCDVHSATNGKEALELVKAVRARGEYFDLYFTDVVMPQMSGLEFLLHIEDRDYDRVTPAVVFTGYAHDEDQKKAVTRARPVSFIVKPLRVTEIQRAVYEALAYSPNLSRLVPYFSSRMAELDELGMPHVYRKALGLRCEDGGADGALR